jgi:hypothetical protein
MKHYFVELEIVVVDVEIDDDDDYYDELRRMK